MAGRLTAPGAEAWVPERLSLRLIHEAAQECRGCELWSAATQAVTGEGPLRSRLVLVGEQPGDKEDLAGEPFVGPAGRLLSTALAEAGIEREEVFLTNAVKHFRFAGRRGKQRIHKTPAQRHIEACRPWLDAELTLVRPTGVVALGATAAHALLGNYFRLTDQRGRILPWPSGSRHAPAWAMATVHPSSVLRSRERDADLERLVADLENAASALREG